MRNTLSLSLLGTALVWSLAASAETPVQNLPQNSAQSATQNPVQNPVAAPARQQLLPPEVDAALARAKVPRDAVSFLVADAAGKEPPRLAYRTNVPMNPASVMKLVTTYAALDTLKPNFTWKTRVFSDAVPADGVLEGNLIIRGAGDPKLVVERLQPMMEKVMAAGVKVIRGDIVLDRSAFKVPDIDPGRFDGEPLKPYNARPDALLINFKAMVMTFTPDEASGYAMVKVDPPMAGVEMDSRVPLAKGRGCGDWRSQLRASVDDPNRLHFAGTYSAACGEKVWPSAYSEPATHTARAVEGMWRNLGGSMTGKVRDASAQELENLHKTGSLNGQKQSGAKGLVRFDALSLPLSEIIYDINKYSNNLMAQHVFLSLGLYSNLGQKKMGTLEAARTAVQNWWRKTMPHFAVPILDNGSGLSRKERITAESLGALLQSANKNRVSEEFLDSLPTAGTDGTMRDRVKSVAGQAFIKTGTLRDATAVAGYADNPQGRQIVVGIINHPNAAAAKPALDALIQWAVRSEVAKLPPTNPMSTLIPSGALVPASGVK